MAPSWPKRVPSGHACSPTVLPAASLAVKRGAVYSPSTWPREP